MINLRPGQREVAKYRGGYMAVPAVPGAGKTTVLAYLAANLIEEGLNKPGKILIVTVMNSAVSNFRERIGDFLEVRGLPRSQGYEVRTLHSLAMTILKEKPDFLLVNNNFQVLDDIRRNRIIERLAKKWLINNRGKWKKHIKVSKNKEMWYKKALENWENKNFPKMIGDAIKYIKTTCLTEEKAREIWSKLGDNSYLKWAYEIYFQYMQELNNNGYLDFDDLIIYALRLLKQDPLVLERLQDRWTFFFEDEAQDSNPLQEEILLLLSSKAGNLVRVGDSNQAIMGTFTSAEPKLFREFCDRNDVKKESILYSGRSSKDIIDFANFLVDWTNESHPQKECRDSLIRQHIFPVGEDDPNPNPKTNGYKIVVKKFEKYLDEITMIARYAENHLRKYPDESVGILVPDNYMQRDIAEELQKREVPFEEAGSITNEQSKTITDVRLAIEYLAQPHRVDSFITLFQNVFLCGISVNVKKIMEEMLNKNNIEEIIFPVADDPFLKLPEVLSDPETYTAFVNGIRTIKKWLQASTLIQPDELVLFLAEDLNLNAKQLEIAQNLALQIKQQLNENPDWQLYDIAQELSYMEGSVKNFIRIVNEQQGFTPSKGKVSLATVHKSKGLEWDTVFLVSVTSSDYPSTVKDKFKGEMWYLKENVNNPLALIKAELAGYSGELTHNPQHKAKIDEISERLRLLYVGITRARKNLMLSYHKKNKFNKYVGPSKVLSVLQRFIVKESGKIEER